MSGKGGTGKTTVATNLFLTVEDSALFDCDVEEPNAHLFLRADLQTTEPVSIAVPKVREDVCTGCRKCQEVCNFNAIAVMDKKVLVFSELCHSCGACFYFCPVGALEEERKEIGTLTQATVGSRRFVFGTLKVGEMMAPPLIRAVKEKIDGSRYTVIDAPPGTSCPMITAAKASDFCVLVTEPTPFGLHDLQIALNVVRDLKIPHGVIINRDGLGTRLVDDFCAEENVPVLMRIPFDRRIAEHYSRGTPIVEAMPEYKAAFQNVFNHIEKECEKR